MPGENCAIVNCKTSRADVGIAFFKVPKEKDNFTKKWASELINVITKDRVVDNKLRAKIDDKEHKKLHVVLHKLVLECVYNALLLVEISRLDTSPADEP